MTPLMLLTIWHRKLWIMGVSSSRQGELLCADFGDCFPLQMASVVCLFFVSNHAVEGSYGAAVERRFSGYCTETLLACVLIVGDNTTSSA